VCIIMSSFLSQINSQCRHLNGLPGPMRFGFAIIGRFLGFGTDGEIDSPPSLVAAVLVTTTANEDIDE